METLRVQTVTGIKKGIEQWVGGYSTLLVNYQNWYVGVTNDPDIRRRAHNHVNKADPLASQTFAWIVFKTCSLREALNIEQYFHKKGMLDKQSKGGVKSNSVYLYVYKKYPTAVDILYS